jgi:MFS family permease
MFRALRHRNFQLFFGGQLISLTGSWMQMMAQSWLVYRLTHSAALLGSVAFATQIPVLFLGPLAGIVADRHRRHRLIVATQTAMMIQALLMAALTLTHKITVWEIFVLALLLGVCNAYDIPARQSFLVEMVGSEDLMNAIALNSSMFNGARIVGPAIAGVLVASLGEGMCFLLNGLSFLAVIAGLLLMKVNSPRPTPSGASRLHQLLEGMRYAYHNVAIRSLLLLLGISSLVGMSYMVLMPIFADKVLHRDAKGLGWLMTAAGFGALLAALWLARRRHALGLDRMVALSCLGFGASLVLFSLSRNFWLSLVLLVPAGFTIMVQMAGTNSLIQSIVTNPMRGRVMGLYTMMFLGMAPFGSLLAGFLAHHFGAPAAVLMGGIASMVSAAVFGFHLPHLKIDDHLTVPIPEIPSNAP